MQSLDFGGRDGMTLHREAEFNPASRPERAWQRRAVPVQIPPPSVLPPAARPDAQATLGFDRLVPPNGYRWWYVDALSADGQHGITLIGFVGSVFSPYYAWQRRRQAEAEPLDHCALNVALYGAGGKRWAMTERGRSSVRRARCAISIGPSALHWNGGALTVEIDEVTVPIPTRLRGTVRVTPLVWPERSFALDEARRHRWTPLAPLARVEVTLPRPGLSWTGFGYLDMNDGDEPLEDAFVAWDWSRASDSEGATIFYDALRRDGTTLGLALHFDHAGTPHVITPPPLAPLPRTLWRVPRSTRSDAGRGAAVLATLEDAPFYARSLVKTWLGGAERMTIHESLRLARFRAPIVQAMLPFRMPRRA